MAAVALSTIAVAAALAGVGGPARAHSCAGGADLRFRAADGTLLAGHRFGGERPGRRTAVVLAHMSEGDLCSWLPYARSLAKKGFFVLAFDFRGFGASKGRGSFRRSPADVTAAVRAARSLGARKVVVAGASLGGIAAVIAAPSIRPPLAGVVAVSAPAAIAGELDAVASARKLAVPTLYLVAQEDRNGSYDFAADARTLFDETRTSEKRLEIVPGALHGTFLIVGSARVRAALERFLRDPAGSVP